MIQDITESRSERFFYEDLNAYTNTFIQRTPKHGIKGTDWHTVDTPICDDDIQAHLHGESMLGTLAKWYPGYAVLDVDDLKSSLLLDGIRNNFHIAGNFGSMVCETSPGSYHVLFRPEYDGKPATVRLLHDILGPQVKQLSASMRTMKNLSEIDLYPQGNRVIRAPFHPSCRFIGNQLSTLEDKLETFNNLQPLDLKSFATVTRHTARQAGKLLTAAKPTPTKGAMKEAADLYQFGLQASSETRYHSQRKVAHWLWRLNLTPEQAIDELMNWVRNQTNGFSKDADAINRGDYRTEQQVRREHEALVGYIWSTFEDYGQYPASTHNNYYGWLTKADIATAAKVCGGNIPRFKFFCRLLSYFNAHKKQRLNVHSGKLIEWCSDKTYLKFLQYFEETGILCRDQHYLANEFSKVIQLNVKPSHVGFNDAATLTDGFGQALNFCESLEEVGHKEIYQLLTQNNVPRQRAHDFLKRRDIS
ncbi:MAG: hypothetical protein JZU65_14170 [Chlorobium sp.]|nr:hypothetical protein [Chlorobium sp.]